MMYNDKKYISYEKAALKNSRKNSILAAEENRWP